MQKGPSVSGQGAWWGGGDASSPPRGHARGSVSPKVPAQSQLVTSPGPQIQAGNVLVHKPHMAVMSQDHILSALKN